MAGKNEPLMRAGGISALAKSLRLIGDKELSKEMKAVTKEAIPESWPSIIEDFVRGMNRIARDFEKKHGASRVVGRYRK